MEFLMGRSLKMSLFNLGLDEVAKKALADADINLDSIFEEEPDAGLGNGGLGRLAACYLDGMATTDICGTGYSILYEYGIFKQRRSWTAGSRSAPTTGCPAARCGSRATRTRLWRSALTARFTRTGTTASTYIQHTNYNSVMAIPSDMYVQGYDGKGRCKAASVAGKGPGL